MLFEFASLKESDLDVLFNFDCSKDNEFTMLSLLELDALSLCLITSLTLLLSDCKLCKADSFRLS